MRKKSNKLKVLIYISVVIGSVFGSYIIYEQKGFFGTNELIIFFSTLLIGAIIAFTILKISNK